LRNMEFKWLAVAILVCTIAGSLALAYELHFGGKIVIADKRADVFVTESAAAREHALNRVPMPPVAVVESGEKVAVIWDTYGKDYWACYVRTSNGIRGWVLCTSLRMVAQHSD
jgi:hypothetical protein